MNQKLLGWSKRGSQDEAELWPFEVSRHNKLYNFQLNQKGQTLKKATKDELEKLYSELKEGEWCYALQSLKRKCF